MPGLRKAQETRGFGIAQFTSSSCIPALDTVSAGTPNCRAINDKVLALARELRPDIVLLHGTWDSRDGDGVAETGGAQKADKRAYRCAGFGALVETRVARTKCCAISCCMIT